MGIVGNFLKSGPGLAKIRSTVEEVLLEARATKKEDGSKDYNDGWNDAVKALIHIGQKKSGIRLWQ